MNDVVLTWTVPNWLTVLLMVFVGFAVIGVAAKFFAKMKAKENA